MDPGPELESHSDGEHRELSSSSSSSIEDAVNTPAARVYFGPLQSPEKKYAPQSSRRRSRRSSPTSRPSRRSGRLSTASTMGQDSVSEDAEDTEDVEEIVDGNSPISEDDGETPINDLLSPDAEPSSALASKISRAHDNPSPPPQMGLLQDSRPTSPHTSSKPMELISVDLDESNESTPDPVPLKLTSLHSPHPVDVDLPASAQGQPPIHTPDGVVDLISFEPPQTAVADVYAEDGCAEVHASHIDKLLGTPHTVPVQHNLLSPSPARSSKGTARETMATWENSADSFGSSPSAHPIREHEATDQIEATDSSDSIQDTSQYGAGPSQPAEPPRILRRSPRLSPRPEGGSQASEHPTKLSVASPTERSTPITPTRPEPSSAGSGSSKRELGSLSPTSTDVLSNLLALPMETIRETCGSPMPIVPPTIFPPGELPSTPRRAVTSPSPPPKSRPTIQNVQRPPSRSPMLNILKNVASSPSKHSTSRAEVPATPARRVPIQQAIAESSISPTKLPRIGSGSDANPSNLPAPGGLFVRPVFSRPPPDDTNRTPARRVPISASPAMMSSMLGSPSRSMRSGSAEPQSTRSNFFAKPSSRALSDSELSTPSKPRSALPFPIRGHHRSHLPEAIAEESELQPSLSRVPATPIAGKSALRQPSSSVSSRIPRIGTKPYARLADKGKEPHKLLQPKLKAGDSGVARPMRLVPAGNSSLSGGGNTATIATSSVTSPLKRKRELEQVSRPSPPGARPYVVIRQAPPSVQKAKTPQRQGPGPSRSTSIMSPVKKPRAKLQVRKVEANIRSRTTTATSSNGSETLEVVRGTSKEPSPVEPRVRVTSPEGTTSRASPPGSMAISSPVSSPSAIPLPSTPPDARSSPDPIALAPPSPLLNDILTGTRRSARVSKTPQLSDTDVFGSSKARQPRRKHQQSKPDSGSFPSMSATALKAITAANTKKNQEYLAALLETEVVRKPGDRPESPTTKIKTVSERQKEEKEKGRRERAARRARRSDTGAEDDSGSAWDGDEPSLVVGPDGKPLRHRRGAGDEEDYVTPEKPERLQKRAKFEAAVDSEPLKRVKWDRGLFDTIVLEDVKPRPRHRPETAAQKGALAGSAKTVRLDNLGNMLDVNSPVNGVVRESIVVKKFVYDNDLDVEPLPPPKSTGKGKKKAKT